MFRALSTYSHSSSLPALFPGELYQSIVVYQFIDSYLKMFATPFVQLPFNSVFASIGSGTLAAYWYRLPSPEPGTLRRFHSLCTGQASSEFGLAFDEQFYSRLSFHLQTLQTVKNLSYYH